MSDESQNAVTPGASGGAQAQRLPLMQQVAESVEYMRSSAATEYKRSGDSQNALLLPISCILLVAAICINCPAPVRVGAFLVPLMSFGYYVAYRIGIVRTFSSRQAYLTWHILIATFLLGGTFALFLVYLGTYLVLTTRGGV